MSSEDELIQEINTIIALERQTVEHSGELPIASVKEIISLVKSNLSKEDEVTEIIKAVSHIGVDFGYGNYELEQKHIDSARAIYEARDKG